ncbi:hypothetical protein VTH82DRAFT_6800 [Thermothelomyces myriococcoides]
MVSAMASSKLTAPAHPSQPIARNTPRLSGDQVSSGTGGASSYHAPSQDSTIINPSRAGYACQTCTRRKVKCDKAVPECSSCRKSKLSCNYEAPRPRTRKRKPSEDVLERLARYERILCEHGLLDPEAALTASADGSAREPITLLWDEPEGSKAGRLLPSEKDSSYVYLNGRLWRDLEQHQIRGVPDDDEEEEEEEEEEGKAEDDAVSPCSDIGFAFPSDPVSAALAGSPRLNLAPFHPTHEEAILLWTIHAERVQPLCRILHISSTAAMVDRVSKEPSAASRTEECLLFAIYHFAIYSMTEEDVSSTLGKSRASLLRRYHFATRQALVNASFLRTAKLPVLQALVMFLHSSRSTFDAHTYWVLTGVAVRIAQRIGLHRDGEKFGLPPFEVEMRRRLFYHLMPLDARAGQMAGVGVSTIPTTWETWDTRLPLNVNDDQLDPAMTKPPPEQQGATEMMVCLSRFRLGKAVIEHAASQKVGGTSRPSPGRFDNADEAEQAVNRAESEMEEEHIRYCDVIDPLHYLTVCMVRCGIAAMRLRIRLLRTASPQAAEADVREAFQLALKILDTNAAVCAHEGLKKYRWHTESFFLWGTWDSFIFVLSNVFLKRRHMFSDQEADTVWDRIAVMYRYHGDLPRPKPALFAALGRLALQAWEARPSTKESTEPDFITRLRRLRDKALAKQGKSAVGNESTVPPEDDHVSAGSQMRGGMEIATDLSSLSSSGMCEIPNPAPGPAFGLVGVDWSFWDTFVQGQDGLDNWQ